MRFGAIPVSACEGAILAHGLSAGSHRLKKGHVLTAEDADRLAAAGVESVIALHLDAGDTPENEAAARLAQALDAAGVTVGEAATGRVNIHARQNGLFRVERASVDAFNAVDPAITLATLSDRTAVGEGEMVATIKIIPLAVAGRSLADAASLMARPGILDVRPFRPHRVGLIATQLAGLKASVMDKTRDLLASRLEPSGSVLTGEQRVAHRSDAVSAALGALARENDMLVVFGASAVADADDVIPAAIRMAGGEVTCVGMPVDPGNLIVVGSLDGKPVIGAPGCARSPKENGFDWVLARLLAGEAVERADIQKMGVGGLLSEIASRPQPRNLRRREARSARVEAVLLAAGRASRMGAGGAHKLLAEFDGEPLVRRAARAALEAPVAGLRVVTGHRAGEVERALSGLDCRIVQNPAFETGMASSLAAGIEALEDETDGALVLLADMPGVSSRHLSDLIDAFRKRGGKAIVRATSGDKRGNPVILPRATFSDIMMLTGDVGARQIIETSGLEIVDVDIGDAAHLDVDTPEAVRAAGGVLTS